MAKPASPTAAEWASTTTVSNENEEEDDMMGPTGCYMCYESNSGGQLVLHYSQGQVPDNAVGFWCPGGDHKIQPFKFKHDAGRATLIKGIAGGDSNRRKYFSGWCQFLKQAVAKGGLVIQFKAEQDTMLFGDRHRAIF